MLPLGKENTQRGTTKHQERASLLLIRSLLGSLQVGCVGVQSVLKFAAGEIDANKAIDTTTGNLVGIVAIISFVITIVFVFFYRYIEPL